MTRPAILLILPFVALLGSPSFAGPRTSSIYAVSTDAVGEGSVRSTGAIYTNDGSAGGGVVGISTISAPSVTARHGYIAQLSEVTAVQLSATPTTVNETETRQLGATILLDDLTSSLVPPAEITWSVASGPLTQISTSGLATAAPVYKDEAAEARGTYAGVIGFLGLTVINSMSDNFGSYASDGIDDGWQFEFFGADNPEAGPSRDPDGDSQKNLFEYTAGLDPTDPNSFFRFQIESVPGSPNQKKLIFSPVLAGRNYVVTSTTDLAVPMVPLTGAAVSNDGNTRTVTDSEAGGPAKFYRVEIELP